MKFFRHYKNKPYKFLGLAKHSETLEELALYETRYENALGHLWVRPKDMFFETIMKEDRPVARFQGLPTTLHTSTHLYEGDLASTHKLILECLGECDFDKFKAEVASAKNILLVTAFIDDRPVGFKLGFAESQTLFYSWLGGVLPEFRGLGVAQDLMKAQQTWCKNNGYTKVKTKTKNEFKSMLLLNIKNGFDITGTEQDSSGALKIIMEKTL